MDKSYLNHIMSESHVDEIDHSDIPQIFADNIARIRVENKFTQEEMAYILGIGKQTYVRIEAGTNASVNAEIALKAANIFRIPVMSLFGFSTSNVEAYKNYMKCTDRTRRTLQSIMNADIEMQTMFAEFDKNDIITVLYFAEEMRDGMFVSRFLHRTENISKYKNFRWYKDADCILELNSNAYHPLYHIGDKLVICSRAPLDGEIGVFMKGSQFYLRTARNSPDATYLLPVTYYKNTPYADIVVDRHNKSDMNQYSKLGTVVAVI